MKHETSKIIAGWAGRFVFLPCLEKSLGTPQSHWFLWSRSVTDPSFLIFLTLNDPIFFFCCWQCCIIILYEHVYLDILDKSKIDNCNLSLQKVNIYYILFKRWEKKYYFFSAFSLILWDKYTILSKNKVWNSVIIT